MLGRVAGTFYDAALALLYPRACAVCGGSVESYEDGAACSGCWMETRIFSAVDVLCWKCGRPTTGTISEEKRRQVRCRHCEHESFTAARAAGVYEGALRASVLALKRDPLVASRLMQLLYQVQQREPLSNATRITPVPLHSERQRTRGFNQAAELGRALSRMTRLPLDEQSLTRTSHTERHRALMDERARRESVEGAFRVTRPRLVEGESILLVDDVFTTGSTASACASALISAGAQNVHVLTIARAV